MELLMPQSRKGRSKANDIHASGANLSRQYKVHTLDSWNKWELLAIIGTMIFLLYIWLYSQSFHFHVAHLYAHFGYPSAQHIVGQRYLKGAGVVKDEEMAMHWFRRASQQNHPYASFNLAVGKMKNMTGSMEVGDVEMLLNVAASQGIQDAQELLENVIWMKSKLLPTKRMQL
ncbi:secretory immunoglobulin A-binding protein EsiB-like [Choloepus didactylus]|uniref:secretory immunoglobulin A-binding protein EsiB-like n=1 Tax=Choloepus didactylus TaxID=27675 RepID=UPI00189F833D|nr:secretory immunoglobulin A-binding protein EsiB-like [Choloepus didactylus]XP_037686260.1 secretory immunoglobulin A-binding protein EsiB-like [Choloepus didactylus]XP_037686261.1 secretory immunoglobulin A-binding protein EsiB-like [Choloepus didactylus]